MQTNNVAARDNKVVAGANATFGTRMTIEQFLNQVGAQNAKVYPRKNKPGYYCMATDNNVLAYVPKDLGQKLENGEEHNDLFMSEVWTPGYEEPMWMLCEESNKAVATFSL